MSSRVREGFWEEERASEQELRVVMAQWGWYSSQGTWWG